MKPDEAERPGVVALKWWSALTNPQHGDRAALARLRRCENGTDTLTIPQAIALGRGLGRLGGQDFSDALGLAIVLAHVKENDPQKLMRAAGWKSFPGEKKETSAGEDRPVLSELRFRRMLQTTRDARIPAFIRLVRILGGKVNVVDVAESFLFWGAKKRQVWAFDYFAAGVSAPSSNDPELGVEQ